MSNKETTRIDQNKPIIDWANRNFQNGYDAKRFNVMIIGIIWLIFQLLLSVLFGVFSFFGGTRGIDTDGLYYSAIVIGLSGVGLYFVIQLRRRTVIYLDGDGVETHGGTKYQWSDLYSVNYGNARFLGKFQLNRIELNFENRKATVPAILLPELVSSFETIPVHKTNNGR